MMRRFFLLMVALCGLLTASGDNTSFWVDNVAYRVNADGITVDVVSCNWFIGHVFEPDWEPLEHIEIPETVTNDGIVYTVTGIADHLTAPVFDLSDGWVESIKLPGTITHIGDWAFAYCSTVSSIELPASVDYIGDYAFMGCSGLSSIELPATVSYIGDDAFKGCVGLTSMEIPNTVTTLGGYAFSDCTQLASVTLPASLASIGDALFMHCSSLRQIDIPASVTTIGAYAFESCTSLTSLTIPESVRMIGRGAFAESGLQTIVNESGNIIIDPDVFSYFEKSTPWYDNQPDGLVCLGTVAFRYKGTMPDNTRFAIPEGITSINDCCFEGCTGLKQIAVPKSVKYIGDRAFEGTQWLEDQPDGMVYVNTIAYRYKGAMPDSATIVLADGTTCISGGCFRGHKAMKSLTIPATVDVFGEDVFFNIDTCEIQDIYCGVVNPDNMQFFWLWKGPFRMLDTDGCVLHVPEGSLGAYWGHPAWRVFTNVVEMSSPLDVSRLELNKKAIVLQPGQMHRLMPKGEGHGQLEWQTDRPDVANVDADGTVTGVASGIAIVTATTGAGASTWCSVYVQQLSGDLNGDNTIDAGDVNVIVNKVLGKYQ